MTTPALIAYTVSAVAWAVAIGMVALPYLLGSPDRRFSRPLAGKSPEKHSADLEGSEAAVAPAAARYDDTPQTWPGPVLPPSEPFDPHWHRWPNSDAALSGLARRDANWHAWTRRHPEGPDNDQDPEKPWRKE